MVIMKQKSLKCPENGHQHKFKITFTIKKVNKMANNTNVAKNFGPIIVDSVTVHETNENKARLGLMNVQVRQIVETIYPSVNVKTGGIFDIADFDVAGQSYTSTRVTWFDAPAGATKEMIEKQLEKFPNARIRMTYSNKVEDVLTDAQHAAVKSGLRTIAQFEDQLRIRDKQGNELPGAPQYSNSEFCATAEEDRDFRTIKNSTGEVEMANAEAGNKTNAVV